MAKKISLIILMFLGIGMTTSCSLDDDHIEIPVEQNTGDEVDDPAKPDEDN
ncbi:hypothetical protein H2O64_21630 [Kordia sp. YSTF-M3]|uniref:Secreted protein n=1 Tax=Kordia aestuariivivens TaxID=2759037 RepID=A0ABR7QFF6_9FLAO|nr:hypothetical protein [Kordia aestuariivivens]MBC8757286.1 hypothetical protein [Kordia aestuariivivens]